MLILVTDIDNMGLETKVSGAGEVVLKRFLSPGRSTAPFIYMLNYKTGLVLNLSSLIYNFITLRSIMSQRQAGFISFVFLFCDPNIKKTANY